MSMTRVLRTGFLVTMCVAGAAQAQNWPSKSVKVIVPVSAGSGIDVVGRAVSLRLAKELGQPLVVENRAGAGTTIGVAAVATAAPDGYTLLFVSSALTTTPPTRAKLGYDVMRDLIAVAPITNTPMIVVAPRGKYKDLADMVAAAKAGKNPITYGINGYGSAAHFATERFRLAAGFRAQPIAYRGTPETLTEIMTDRLGLYFSPLTATQAFINDGKVDALATTSRRRASKLPNVPTLAEAGYPNTDFDFWVGLFAPAKTPREIVEKLHRETRKIADSTEFRNMMSALGGEPMDPMTIEQFNAYVQAELTRNAAIAKAAGLVPQ